MSLDNYTEDTLVQQITAGYLEKELGGDLNERIAEKLETLEIDDVDVAQRLERELKRDYRIITATSGFTKWCGISCSTIKDEAEVRAGEVFQHVYRVYPRLPSPIYGAMILCQ